MIHMFEVEEQPRLPRLAALHGRLPIFAKFSITVLDESNDKSTLKVASMLGLRSRPFFADWTTRCEECTTLE
jgi:hypothetical protein